tara:strand:+ start:97 stop:1095 length:999 start_codon:yes stop_codon:yes gene_type:complete
MAIKLTIELIRFLNAAKRLYNQNALTKSQILDFARREFGEVTGVLKTRLDKLFQKPATGIKKQETKGEVVPIKKKIDLSKYNDESLNRLVDEDIMLRGEADTLSDFGKDYGRVKEIEKRRKEIKEIIEAAQKNPELVGVELKNVTPKKEGITSLDVPTEKEMVENALQTIADRKRLGTRSQESFIRTAVREFLERRLKDGSLTIPDKKDLDAITGVRQGGVDPIDVFRKAYGEDAVATVARMEEQFPDAFQGSSFKEIGDEFEKLFKREAENFGSELPKPKEKYGFDEGLMTDQQLKEKLEQDLREKQMLEDFDPTDRTKNADGGLAEILKV